MSIIGHIKAGRVRIYKLNTFKALTDSENAIYNDKHKKNAELLAEIHSNANVRSIPDRYLTEHNDEIVYLKVCHNEILWQILRDGIIIGNKEYMLFTATTGQVRNITVTLMRKDFFEKHKGFLMVGLSVEGINANGGMNVGKHLAYNALSLSSSVKPETAIDIDRCIVVNGLETVVRDKVKYIDIQTDDNGQCYVADTPKEYQEKDIPIEHTDGAGMFIPGELHSSCQIRGGYIKGAMFSFDFRLLCHEVAHNSVLIDAWGEKHDVEAEDIRYILTTSQLKMWKQYDSWEDYKTKFKENNLELSINSYANPQKEEVTFSYQFLQTLPYNTDITELCKSAIEDLTKLKTDIDYVKAELGYTLDEVTDDDTNEDVAEDKVSVIDTNVEKGNYYIAKALDLYPALIKDKHIKNKNTDKVADIVGKFVAQHNLKSDRSIDDCWETFDKVIVNAEEKPQSIVTRNLKAVKRIVDEGYAYMLKRTCVDQYKKKCFVFYENDRISEIKNEEDAISRAKYEEKHTSSRKEMADTRMSELIKKAMEVK